MDHRHTLIVNYEVKPDLIDFALEELIKVSKKIREEEGCMQLDLLQSQEDIGVITIYETWETRDLWLKHLSSSHMHDFSMNTKACFEDVRVSQYSFI